MARLQHLSGQSVRISRVVRDWFALKRQKERRLGRGGEPELPLPTLAHHPGAGLPGTPLFDDIYLAENPGALVSDEIELSVLDPTVNVVEGDPPTEEDWLDAWSVMVSYNEALGRWHYENAGVGESKTDGDAVWIRGRFRRAGQPAGPWSVVETVVWSL